MLPLSESSELYGWDVGTASSVTGRELPGEPDVERRQRRREALLDAAIDAIRDLGPKATMEQLANAGGVTKPILYRHFGDRDGLIGAIASRFSAELLMSVSTPLLATTDPRVVLEDTVTAYVGFLEREPSLYAFLVQQPNVQSEHRTPVGPLVDSIAPQIARVTAEQLELAGQDPASALPWAYGIVGLVHQATNWWLRDGTMPRDEFISHLTRLLWGGLSHSVGSAD